MTVVARAGARAGATSRRVAGTALMAVALLVGLAGPAEAHVRSSTGYSEVRSGGDGDVRYQLSLEYELLARAAGLAGPAGAAALDAGRDAVAAYVEPRVRVSLDGVGCDPAVEDMAVEDRDGVAYARLALAYDCPGSTSGSYSVDYDVFSGADAVVDDHTNVVDYDLGGHEGRVVLDAGQRSFVAGQGGLLSSVARFVGLGLEHIFAGIDHILFVVALLLGAASLTSVLKVASAFTLAHSVTLALAVVGWVDVPAAVVEPLIALSIAYVAAENLLGAPSRHRLAVVFAFGLLHGLGFASALRFTDEVSWGLVTSLVGFNVGIELGQALLIAALFPLLLVARRFEWSRPAHASATASVALLGLVWFFQRVSLT